MFGFEEFVEALRSSPIQLDWGAGWAFGDDNDSCVLTSNPARRDRGVDQSNPDGVTVVWKEIAWESFREMGYRPREYLSLTER